MNNTYRILTLVAVLLFQSGCSKAEEATDCLPTPPYKAKYNKHGLQVWQNSFFVSFLQPRSDGSFFQVPQEWQAIGAEEEKTVGSVSCARFPSYQSVTFIDPVFFSSQILTIPEVAFPVKMVWRKTLTAEQVQHYQDAIVRSFQSVAQLYPYGVPNNMLGMHTVMITAGIIEAGDKASTRNLYPNVGSNASYVYRWPDARMEELFIHAVAHLYNRSRFMWSYRPIMPTLSFIEYQEYVASWAESRYMHSDTDRWRRALHLLHIHEGVTSPDVKLGKEAGSFRTLAASLVPIPTNVLKHLPPHMKRKREYAHYVLAPLVLIALDGMLSEAGKDVRVEDILRDVHTNRYGTSFYGVLGLHLSAAQMAQFRRWEEGIEAIPRAYVFAGLKKYDTGHDPVDYQNVTALMPVYRP